MMWYKNSLFFSYLFFFCSFFFFFFLLLYFQGCRFGKFFRYYLGWLRIAVTWLGLGTGDPSSLCLHKKSNCLFVHLLLSLYSGHYRINCLFVFCLIMVWFKRGYNLFIVMCFMFYYYVHCAKLWSHFVLLFYYFLSFNFPISTTFNNYYRYINLFFFFSFLSILRYHYARPWIF